MRGMAIDIGDEQAAPIGELIGVAAALLLLTLLFRSVVAMTLTLVAAALRPGRRHDAGRARERRRRHPDRRADGRR